MSTDLQQRSPSFRAFYQEEQRKFDAKAAALLAPAQQALIAANREKADIWRKTPVEKWTTVKDMEFLSSVAPDIAGIETAPAGYFDDPEVATAKGREAKVVLDNFLRTLPQRRGVVLSISAQKKFRHLVSCLIKTRDVIVTDSNLNLIFDWTMTGDTIYGDEFGIDKSLVAEQPEPEIMPTVDDVLQYVDTTTRDGDSILRKIVDAEWMQSFAPLVNDWYGHLATDHGITVTSDDANYLFNPVTGVFAKFGWAINPENLNAARRHMASVGRWAGAYAVSEYFDAKLNRGEIDFPIWNYELQRMSRAGVWTRPLREAQAKGL